MIKDKERNKERKKEGKKERRKVRKTSAHRRRFRKGAARRCAYRYGGGKLRLAYTGLGKRCVESLLGFHVDRCGTAWCMK